MYVCAFFTQILFGNKHQKSKENIAQNPLMASTPAVNILFGNDWNEMNGKGGLNGN